MDIQGNVLNLLFKYEWRQDRETIHCATQITNNRKVGWEAWEGAGKLLQTKKKTFHSDIYLSFSKSINILINTINM